eukprot:1186933-Prorocentrum_minimum.AAC.2
MFICCLSRGCLPAQYPVQAADAKLLPQCGGLPHVRLRHLKPGIPSRLARAAGGVPRRAVGTVVGAIGSILAWAHVR